MVKPTILALDDESDNLDALERIFRKTYRFLRATSGAEALQILAQNPRVDIIITDQRMPQMTGVEFLEKTLATHPKTVRILLTGYTDIDSIIAAVNQGHIFRYITKPWDTTDLINSVEQAMQYYARGEELEIKNQELEKAYRELKVLDETKNKFMILINHELKTPLTIIQSFLALLQETTLSEDQIVYTDRIKKSASRLQEVIDDTLVLTRATGGVLKLNKQSLNPGVFINEVLRSFQDEIQKKNLSLQKIGFSENSNASFSFDPQLMTRVIHHLMANALRFATPHSELICTLQMEGGENLKDQWQFSLENEGVAIPENLIKEIHTPFKLQSEIMNHSKGLGLGLSVVHAIATAHQGQVTIENLKGPNGISRVKVTITIR